MVDLREALRDRFEQIVEKALSQSPLDPDGLLLAQIGIRSAYREMRELARTDEERAQDDALLLLSMQVLYEQNLLGGQQGPSGVTPG